MPRPEGTERQEKRIIPTESKPVILYLELSHRYSHIDFPKLLSGPTIPLLSYLDEPISVAELAERTDNYRNTVNRRVKQLRNRGILSKDGTSYRLNDNFQSLNRSAREFIHHGHRQRASAVMDAYTILWENYESFLVQTNREVTYDSFLTTGPKQFGDYGLPAGHRRRVQAHGHGRPAGRPDAPLGHGGFYSLSFGLKPRSPVETSQ